MDEKRWVEGNGKSVMGGADARREGKLTRRLHRLARESVDPEDLVDPDQVEMPRRTGPSTMPDCANCPDRCCVHKEPDTGILLSLEDVAHLVDSGFEDLIVGTFTFRKTRKGKFLPEIDQMPRLAKKQGYCIFYDAEKGICTGYAYRPTICRRYPFEIEYRKKTGAPFARYIPDAPCVKVRGDEYEGAIRRMIREAVVDENISFEDATLIPDHHEELREIGFDRWLPPPEECPEPE